MIKKLGTLSGIFVFAPALALVPMMAQAQLPTLGSSWTVDNGAINNVCPAGFQCEVLSFGDGFAQIQWVGAGGTFIQTIITDLDATGGPGTLNFSDENFVQLGASNGIMSNQNHQQVDADGVEFNASSIMNIGWANPNPDEANPNLIFNQSFNSPDADPGSEFIVDFTMRVIHGETSADDSRSISVAQLIGLDAVNDAQRFRLERRDGSFTFEGGTLTLGSAVTDNEGSELTGGDLSWLEGEDVMVRWIGQEIDIGDGQGQSTFGFQGATRFNAQGAIDDDISTFSTVNASIDDGQGGINPPFDWHAIFGDVPTMSP